MKTGKSLNTLLKIYSYNITYASIPLSVCLAIITIFLGFLSLWVPIVVLAAWAALLLAEAVVGLTQGVALRTKPQFGNQPGVSSKEQVVYKKVRYHVFRSTQASIMNGMKILSALVILGAVIAAIYSI